MTNLIYFLICFGKATDSLDKEAASELGKRYVIIKDYPGHRYCRFAHRNKHPSSIGWKLKKHFLFFSYKFKASYYLFSLIFKGIYL